MRKLIAVAGGTLVFAMVTLAAPAPVLARGSECTYTGPVYTENGTYYYVTRTVYKRNGGYVRTLTPTTREPKNCEHNFGT